METNSLSMVFRARWYLFTWLVPQALISIQNRAHSIQYCFLKSPSSVRGWNQLHLCQWFSRFDGISTVEISMSNTQNFSNYITVFVIFFQNFRGCNHPKCQQFLEFDGDYLFHSVDTDDNFSFPVINCSKLNTLFCNILSILRDGTTPRMSTISEIEWYVFI